MNQIFKEALEVQTLLTDLHVAYTFVGGIANAVYGAPRLTHDADVLILLSDAEVKPFISKLKQRMRILPEDPYDFAAKTRVIPCELGSGFRIDFVLAEVEFERELIHHSREISIDRKNRLKVCSAEDLIIMKVVSGRPKDLEDVNGILLRQGSSIDQSYVETWLKRFETALDRSDLVAALKRIKAQG